MDFFNKPYRHRHIWLVIKLSVVLLCFLSSKDVVTVIYHLFRAKVTRKTVCEWAKKFPVKLPKKKIKYEKTETNILFADEKFVYIKDIKSYWWTLKDHLGNVLASMITIKRDAASAKELFRRAKAKINGTIHAVVHDGLKSYDKPIKRVFGRKCKSIVSGIKGKFVMLNKDVYWITNNSAESINAQIDNYYARLHYNFNDLESANHFVNMFLYRRHLREVCT